MPNLSSVTSWAEGDPLSPSHFNAKFNVLVSNISLVNSAVSSGGGNLSGSGATNYLPVWSGVTSLASSIVSQNSGILGVGGPASFISFVVLHSSATTATRGVIRMPTGGDIFTRINDNSANVAMLSHDSTNNRVFLASSVTGGQNVTVVVNHDLKWYTDGTYTIGNASADRPRRMYLSDYVVVGNTPGSGNKGAFISNYRTDILACRNASDNSDIVLWGANSTNEILQGTLLNSNDLVIKAPILQDYAEKTHAFGTISANTVASMTSGPIFTATATSNVSFQIVNAPASPNGGNATFWLTASGSTITFSFLSVNFGAQGTPSGIPNGTGMVVNTMTVDGGLTFRGSYTTGYT